MNSRIVPFVVALFLLLSGCITEKLPAVSVYTLSPDLGATDSLTGLKPEKHRILVLDRIRGSRVYSGTDLLYTDNQYGQNSYAYSRWSDSPANMLLLVFQKAIEKSGRFQAVVLYTSQSLADLRLETNLFDFSHHINEDGSSEGVISLHCYLIDNNKKEVLASREFTSSVPVSTQNAQGAAAALNGAAANVAGDLADWLSQAGRQK